MPNNNKGREQRAPGEHLYRIIESPGFSGGLAGEEMPVLAAGWCPAGSHWVLEFDAVYETSVPTCNVHLGVALVDHP